MGRKFSFIHTSDLHLGSILCTRGNTPERVQQVLKNATNEAFERICQLAIKHCVNFIIISGDVFDNESKSVKAYNFFLQKCAELQKHNINVFMIGGNHDSLGSENIYELFYLPENVHIFDCKKPELKEIKNTNGEVIAQIIGQSYCERSESRKIHTSFRVPKKGVLNIGMLHTQLDPYNNNYVPCSQKELIENETIDYWALGHIHQHWKVREKEPAIYYPGIPQGRHMGEEGKCGCLLIEVDSQFTNVHFVPTSSVIWKRIVINIDEDPENIPYNLTDLENLLKRKADLLLSENKNLHSVNPTLNGHSVNGFVVQWVIRGKGPIHKTLTTNEEDVSQILAESLQNRYGDSSPFIWTDSVIINTKEPLPEIDEIADRDPTVTDLLEVVKQCLEDPLVKEDLTKELGQIWEDKFDHEKINIYKFQLDVKTYQEIVKKAQELVLENLILRGDYY